MINQHLTKILLFSILVFSSCAKTEDFDSYEITKNAWTEYINNNYQDLEPVNGLIDLTNFYPLGTEGLYYSILEDATDPSSATAASEEWVRVKYNGYKLNGGLFVTRYEDTSKLYDRWYPTTNFETQYVCVTTNDDNLSDVPEALNDAFMNMQVGQKIRIYVPYYLGWGGIGMAFGYGYGGGYDLMVNENFIMDIELFEIISDIEDYQTQRVTDYVADNNSSEWTSFDTSSSGSIYYRELDEVTNPAGYLGNYIGDDVGVVLEETSIVQIYYELWTIPNGDDQAFMIDTNLWEMGIAQWDFLSDVDFAASYTNSNSVTTDYPDAVTEIMTSIKGGYWYEAVFTSEWGYAEDGLVPSETTAITSSDGINDEDFGYSNYYSAVTTGMVQAYQPLRIKFFAKVDNPDVTE